MELYVHGASGCRYGQRPHEPAPDVRQRLGLAKGGMVYVEETDGGVMLRTVPQIVAHSQVLAQLYAGESGLSLTDFIAARMKELGE